MKLVSHEAWALLQSRFGGGPELAADGCPQCVEELFSLRLADASTAERAEALTAALSEDVPSGGGGGGAGGETFYYVPKLFAKKWPKWLKDGEADATAELLCHHGGVRPLHAHGRLISAAAWGHVSALFPSSEPLRASADGALLGGGGGGGGGGRAICETCEQNDQADQQAKLEAKADAKTANQQKKVLLSRFARLLEEKSILDAEQLKSASALYLVDMAWLNAWRLHMQTDRANHPGPLRGAALCEAHQGLLYPPELAIGEYWYETWRRMQTASGAGGAGGAGGDGAAECALTFTSADKVCEMKLAEQVYLMTEEEAAELAAGADLCSLPKCTLRHPPFTRLVSPASANANGAAPTAAEAAQPLFDVAPAVCVPCYQAKQAETKAAVLEFESEQIHVQPLSADPTLAAAASKGGDGKENGEGGGGGTQQGSGPLASASVGGAALVANASGRRRSGRAGAGKKLSVLASSSTTVLNLKLLIYQAADEYVPSQQRLFYDGRELLDQDDAPLSEVGMVPSATVQLFHDKTLESDTQAAFDAHAQQTAKKEGRSNQEDGFLGSALISSVPRGRQAGGGGGGATPMDTT